MRRHRGDRFEGPRRNKLYRNTDDKRVAGVCSGVADYFGFDVTLTRVVVLVAAVFFMPSVVIVYAILALILDEKPTELGPRRSSEDLELERRVRAEPHSTLNSVKHRFRDLDRRLQRIEKYVTSDRFILDQKFEELRD